MDLRMMFFSPNRCRPAGLGILICLFANQAFAFSETIPKTFPDRANLTGSTFYDQGSGRFIFSDKVKDKWDKTEEGRTKERVLGELLIYRKFAIEFLLLARDRMRYLGVGLGMTQDPDIMTPHRLEVALRSAFKPGTFREMTTRFISPALSPVVDVPRFNVEESKGFWREILRESVGVVQRQAYAAHAEETVNTGPRMPYAMLI